MWVKKLRNSLIAAMGPILLRLLWSSLRMTIEDRGRLLSNRPRDPIIYAFWHNRMLLMPTFHSACLKGSGVVCLISASSDGEMIAKVVERFGMKTARGSSSRRGKEALRELTEYFENGMDVAITPDGPRGPGYQVQQGIIGLAQRRQAWIYPLSYEAEHKIELKSWDRFIIPLPFSTCRFIVGKPVLITRTRTDEEFELERRKLEGVLLELAGITAGQPPQGSEVSPRA